MTACAALLTGALWGITSSASATVLYDQTTGTAGGYVNSSVAEPPTAFDAQGADDFTVPAGTSWTIASVDVRVGTINFNQSATVILYADAGTLPGGILFQQDGIPLPESFTPSIQLSGAPVLGPGKYWLSVVEGPVAGWYWRRQDPVQGSPAVWRNPGGGFATGCGDFQPVAACVGPDDGQDFMFRLNGEATGPQPSSSPEVGPTGQRAAALKHCKKKKSKKARKRCRRRAMRLPV